MPETLRILFVTTGYPRFAGDVFGCFIEDVAKKIGENAKLTILAPHAPSYPLHLLVSEREGKPNVIFQAMACGIPSLATPVGGIPEQIVHGQTGWLANGQAIAIVEAWQSITEHYNLPARSILATAGLQAQVRLHHLKIDVASIAKQHHELYQSLFVRS